MATPRLSPVLLRTLRSSIAYPARLQAPLHTISHPIALPAATYAYQLPRYYSKKKDKDSPTGKFGWKEYTFDGMQKAISSPSPHRIIVDVREPSELLEMGTIPGAINIPIMHNPDSFAISDEEFKQRHGIERPGKDKELIFFCMAGVRSHAATGAARDWGWTKAADYPGSWNQWSWLGGKVQKWEGGGKDREGKS